MSAYRGHGVTSGCEGWIYLVRGSSASLASAEPRLSLRCSRSAKLGGLGRDSGFDGVLAVLGNEAGHDRLLRTFGCQVETVRGATPRERRAPRLRGLDAGGEAQRRLGLHSARAADVVLDRDADLGIREHVERVGLLHRVAECPTSGNPSKRA